MARKYTYLQPTYYKDFKCSGDKCKTNCCNYNWTINVDKETYKKYREVREPKEFAKLLNDYVKRNRNSKGSWDYAKIVQKKELKVFFYNTMNGAEEVEPIEIYSKVDCVFQDENGLCIIHKNLGYEWLSKTCKMFPRVLKYMFGNYERSMYVSCEEVSRLFYNRKDGIEFELVEEEVPMNESLYISLTKNEGLILNYFDDIRLISLQILQLREFSLEDRMILLTIFLFKIDEFHKQNKYKEIEEYTQTFIDSIDNYKNILEINRRRHDVLFKIVLEVINNPISNLGMLKLVEDLKAIEFNLLKACSVGKTEEEHNLKIVDGIGVISEKYEKYKENYDKIMKDKQYYVENIFVNNFFTMGYPYDGKNSIKECCTMFVWNYLYYKCLLTGYLADKEDITEDELHNIAVIFGRGNADQSAKLKTVLDAMKDANLDNLALFAVLIKSA